MKGGLLWVLLALVLPGGAARLEVAVAGVRGTEGLLRLSLFRAADGFPEDASRAARTLSIPVSGSTAWAAFDSLDPGVWALAVLHDRNGNGRLDRNVLGVPREGIGASREAVRRLGPPRFEDARFVLPPRDTVLRLSLRYW